jgi:predicted RNA methylase
MDFQTRDDVIVWIIKNQFGRRNLPAYERARLALRLKPVLAARGKEAQGTRTDILQISAKCPIDTRKEIAVAAGVSHDTIAKVEKIEAKATPEVKEQLRNGEISINQAYNAIKLDEKKESILQAQRDITSQADGTGDAVLYIGNSIGRKLKNKCDLLLTDPPYSTDVEDIDAFVASWLYAALDNVKDTGFAYVFIGAYPDEMRAYLNAKIPEHMHMEQVLVWTYKNTLGQNPKDRYKQNWQACLFYRGINAPALDCPLTNEQWAVQEINAPDGRQGDRYHAWQKPMEIGERFIRHTTKPGDKVYDPFACTGTFLLAAAKLGRRGVGMEINPENAEIAYSRGCDRG